jgi:FkbM family methyltransferase
LKGHFFPIANFKQEGEMKLEGIFFGNNRILTTTTFGGILLLSTNDLSVSPSITIEGVYEVALTKFMIATIKPGDVLFDVGANQGYFTVLMGMLTGRSGKVIAYEANAKLMSLIQDNANINFIESFTEIRNKAVFSKKDQLTFYASERYLGNSSLYNENEITDCIDTKTEWQIETEPLDIHSGIFPEIKLIKMDIEGAEYDAFLGMTSLLNNRTVEYIIFEWNQSALGERAKKLFEFLLLYKPGYSFHGIDNDGVLFETKIETLLDARTYPYVVMKKR